MSKGKRPIDEIAPDDFLSTWGVSTYEEAFERAEQAPTTTPDDEIKRCPHADCLSQRIRRKPGYDDQHQIDTEYVCTACRRHFDDPIVGEPDDAGELIVVDTSDGPGELAEPDADAFEWVSEDDLAEPPVGRRLEQLDDRSLTALAIVLYAPWHHTDDDPSYRDLGTVFPYSRDWVGERVRAWKDGEHRDLVADPRPWGRQ